MRSNEQRYRDRVEQNDAHDRELVDDHLSSSVQTDDPTSNQRNQDEIAERFMRSLQQIEVTGDVEPLVALFADNADVLNLAMSEPLQGQQHIRQFWQKYLSVFDRIHSRFTHVAEGNGTITLEWISEGALSSGEPFSYRGVSILKTKNGRVQHFRTYYDSAAFLPQGAK
ncbi:nuclear transport factor 2 family protein [Leptolyngbya sp. GB1-A1]|uniref:nuclear transport factor 2 family protein n=1 Tax=Leptolyngbya sp. GB1-A1 TaxID=2933908 RepID=UPI0032968204